MEPSGGREHLMGRLRRFEEHRFIGDREAMIAYDCDDAWEFDVLRTRVEGDRLDDRNLLQAFGPDTAAEARNRGFRPARRTDPIPVASAPSEDDS